MVSRHRRIALGALVVVVLSSTPTIAAAQTTTPPSNTVTTVRRATTTVRRAATTVKRTTTAKQAATTAPPATTAAATTLAPTTVASTISPTTIELVTTPSVSAARANDASSTRTVNGVIVGLFVLAGLVALLTFWFYKRTAPLPAELEMLEFMGRKRWRKAPAVDRAAQLAALRAQIGEVPPENIVNVHPVPVDRPVWQPSEAPDDSVADALVALVAPPADAAAVGDPAVGPPAPAEASPPAAGTGAESPIPPPAERPADTLDPHG
jgi:hypothetical protein